jgi:hypothetical protein
MMLIRKVLSSVPVVLVLASCTSGPLSNQNSVSALPLDSTIVNSAEAAVPGTASARSSVSKVVYDSETKCAAFLNSLVLTETGTNTSLDMLTTVFSALGTAYCDRSLAHGRRYHLGGLEDRDRQRYLRKGDNSELRPGYSGYLFGKDIRLY